MNYFKILVVIFISQTSQVQAKSLDVLLKSIQENATQSESELSSKDDKENGMRSDSNRFLHRELSYRGCDITFTVSFDLNMTFHYSKAVTDNFEITAKDKSELMGKSVTEYKAEEKYSLKNVIMVENNQKLNTIHLGFKGHEDVQRKTESKTQYYNILNSPMGAPEVDNRDERNYIATIIYRDAVTGATLFNQIKEAVGQCTAQWW